MRRRSLPLGLVLVLLIPAVALACLWDSETLMQERSRFPSVLELITGKFLRHSPEYYEWRIKDREKKLVSDSKNVGHYDDIAVGYAKLGQYDKAIETILKKEEIEPGLYETYSNLGTFYILAGDFKKGLPYIDKALEIKPDAHFGREKYQKWLVEYAISRTKDGKLTFPLRRSRSRYQDDQSPMSFVDFMATRVNKSELAEEEVNAAVTGVLGMMRFANHENPLLLEALGDLLIASHRPERAARQLAARAYLKASYVAKNGEAKQAYREFAKGALGSQTPPNSLALEDMPLPDLEAEFQKELADADQWYAALKERELEWIRAGKDVEAEFLKLYTDEPVALAVPQTLSEQINATPPTRWLTIGGATAAVLALSVVLLVLLFSRTSRSAAKKG